MNPPIELSPVEQEAFFAAYEDALSDTGDEMLALLAAWGAVRKDQIMRVRGGKSTADRLRVRGWAMLFTDRDQLDLDEEFFDQATQTLLDYYPRAPLWMEHGYDGIYGVDPIGYRSAAHVFRRGVVLEHLLHDDHPMLSSTLAGLDAGEFSYSTDSIWHYVQHGKNPATGYNGIWFAAGCSLTRTPAEPALGAVVLSGDYIKSIKHAAAEAREAQSGVTPIVVSTHNRRTSMLEQLLNGLAAFFGVEASQDAVKGEMSALLEQLAGGTGGTPPPEDEAMSSADMPDLAQLRAALGLPEDADVTVITGRLNELLSMLAQPAAGQGKSARKFDFGALTEAAKAAALAAPALGGKVPAHTQTQHQAGGKSSRFNAPAIGRNTKAPGVAGLVRGVLGGKSESAMKAMGYSIGPNGGYFLNQEVANEMIELFRAQAIVNQLGATIVPMTGIETLTYRKQLTGASATYRGEAQTINQSEPTFGTVQLQLKELVAATRVNRRLLRNADANLEAMIRNDLQIAINLRGDLAALRGTGGIPNETGSTGAEPRGIRYTTGVTITSLGTNGAVPTIDDFIAAWGRIEDANVPTSDSWGIAMSPRTKRTLENITDTTGQLLDVARWSQGYDYLTTTQISNALTVGSSTDTSEVYLGAWEYLIVGVGQDIEVIVDESVYRTSGEIYIEATMMHDVGVAQPVGFQVLTGVRA